LSTSDASRAVRAAAQCSARMALLYAVSLLVQRDLRAWASRKTGVRLHCGVASHFSWLCKQRVRHLSTVWRSSYAHFSALFGHTLASKNILNSSQGKWKNGAEKQVR
jgi:hypothetical protein